jgi:hypothetical protein
MLVMSDQKEIESAYNDGFWGEYDQRVNNWADAHAAGLVLVSLRMSSLPEEE